MSIRPDDDDHWTVDRADGPDLREVSHGQTTTLVEQDARSTTTHESSHARHYESIGRKTAISDRISGYDSAGSHNMRFVRAASQAERTISELNGRVRALEMQLSAKPNGSHEGRLREIDATTTRSHETTESFAAQWRNSSAYPPDIKPQLCEKTWAEFSSKGPTDDLEYAIDVLMEEPSYEDLMSISNPKNKKRADKRNTDVEHDLRKNSLLNSTVHGTKPVPSRIRINSPLILRALADIDASLEVTTSMVMLRPFKFLVHHDEQIRDLYRGLEMNNINLAAGKEASETSAALSSEASLETSQPGGNADLPQRTSSIEHLQCLINFIDTYLNETVQKYQSDVDDEISFRDLWYIFTPGANVYFPLKHPRGPLAVALGSSAPEIFQSRYNILWRVCGTGGGRPRPITGQSRGQGLEIEPFWVNLYYIDFDGRFFCPITHKFGIMPFTGKRQITTLEFYPIRFQPDSQKTMQDHTEKGWEIYRSITETHSHYYYAGPTLTAQPCGCSIKTDPPASEYVESEVIVDFRTTLMAKPSWRPETMGFQPPPIDPERRDLLIPNQERLWVNSNKTAVPRLARDNIYDDYLIDEERAEVFRDQAKIFSPVANGTVGNQEQVSARSMCLLPGRVFGFVLRTRTFALLWLWRLEKINAQRESLSSLQLRDNTDKDRLFALVKTHFNKLKRTQHSTAQMPRRSELYQDFIRGKGRGLVFMLHGAPGLGKTCTAVAIAAANGRPLIQITCGDLGLTPIEVEKALNEIFRYAQLWNCVLLLDECDIFLEKRSKADLSRNGLVAVFLRVLENYAGVLFLTTNRVGVLDDAIKSRITWHLFYRPLDWNQTKKIWALNLKNAGEDNDRLAIDHKGIMKYAKAHYFLSKPERRWNGRQIQNAFKVATSLAEWATYEDDQQNGTENPDNCITTPYRLSIEHFVAYATEIEAFGDYLEETQGFTEAERAFQAQERADNYDPSQSPELEQPLDAQESLRPRVTLPRVQTTSSLPYESLSPNTMLSPPYFDGKSPSPRLSPLQRRSSNSRMRNPSNPPPGSESIHVTTQNNVQRRGSFHNAGHVGTGPNVPPSVSPLPTKRLIRTTSASQSTMSSVAHTYQSTTTPNPRGRLPPPPLPTNEDMDDSSEADLGQEADLEASTAYNNQHGNGKFQAIVTSESEDNDVPDTYLQPQQQHHQFPYKARSRSRHNYSDRAQYHQ